MYSKIFKTVTLTGLVLFFCAIHLYGQNNKKNLIGTHVAFGTGIVDGGHIFALKGQKNYDVKYYYTIGVDYAKQLSKRWDFCSGFEYSRNDMTYTPSYVSGVPEERRRTYKAHLSMATIPVQFKYHAGKFVYFNGGMFLNVRSKMREIAEWAEPFFRESKFKVPLILGFGLGIGFEHEFDSGIVLSLNPYVRWNGVQEGLQYVQEGVRLGVGYKF